ncbi:MAG: serine hydrolase [Caldilineales bacterium]
MIAHLWRWTTYRIDTENVTVDTPTDYMLTLFEDGTLEIKADCNTAAATYFVDGFSAGIEIGPATLAACAGDSRSEQFLQFLGKATQFIATDAQLIIILDAENSMMVFETDVTTVVDFCGDAALTINTVEDTLAPELSATLDQALVSLVQSAPRPGPGAVMLIQTAQGRYFKSVGVADVETCAPLAADSPYQIGSNTKMMTSAILFQLQEEGVLSISDPLSKWLPDLAAKLPNGDAITIDMMLTHTSGLHDYFDLPTADGISIEEGAEDNKGMLTRAFTPEELVQVVVDSGLSNFEPAAEGQWSYSNTGYILLGLIIEKATGKSYEDNLKERIFEPLGLEQTYLQTDVPEPGALPQAYYHSPFDYTTGEWNASQGWAAGAVVSTPEEFAVFLKALFTGQLFKDPATLELMKQPAAASADRLAPGTVYGHGMLDNNGVLGHGGQTLGFLSEGGYIPGEDITIVMWSNAAESNVSRSIVPAIAGIVTGAGQNREPQGTELRASQKVTDLSH